MNHFSYTTHKQLLVFLLSFAYCVFPHPASAQYHIRGYGDNGYLQIGLPTYPAPPNLLSGVPRPIRGLTNIVAITQHLALKSDGTVFFTLGAAVPGLSSVTGIAESTGTGLSQTHGYFALTSDGRVWSFTDSTAPAVVPELTHIIAISATFRGMMALQSDGTIWTWGNTYTAGAQYTVSGPTNWVVPGGGVSIAVSVEAEALLDFFHPPPYHALDLVLASDGTVYSVYNSHFGPADPINGMSVTNAAAVAGGFGHSLVLKRDGTVTAWGRNDSGQLGRPVDLSTGQSTYQNPPQTVSGLSGVTAIAAGDYHSLALTSDGTLYAWGKNNEGQLGDGTGANSATPVIVRGISGVRAIVAAEDESIALKSDGTVWEWGAPYFGTSPSTLFQAAAPVTFQDIATSPDSIYL